MHKGLAITFQGLLVGLIGLGGVCALASETLRFQYSSQVPLEQQQLIDEDLQLLRGLEWGGLDADADHETSRLLQIPELTAGHLESWLSARARYLVDPSFDFSTALVVDESTKVVYAKKIPQALHQTEEASSNQLQVVISNVSGPAFQYGKSIARPVALQIEGVGSVPLTHSQVGVFVIGAGLFSRLGFPDFGDGNGSSTGEDVLTQFFARINRLKSLFHEARHGDGNGKNMLFPHVECPEDHQYAGYPVCDPAANGAYRVGSLITKAAWDSCGQADRQAGTCSEREVEVLKLIYAQDLLRIISPLRAEKKSQKVIEFDPTPEMILVKRP